MDERVVGRSTIGLLNPFEEGEEHERHAANVALMGTRRVLAARAKREWREIRPERLERRGRFYVHADTGHVYEPVRADVWAGGDPTHELNAHLVTAYVLRDGDVALFLGESDVARNAEQLDFLEADKAERERLRAEEVAAKAERHERALATYRDKQARRRLTLADVEGRALPTVADAAAIILDAGGTLAVQGGRLAVEVPERFAPQDGEHEQLRARVLDATRVLVACSEVVIGAVESGSSKPLTERLPRVHAGAGGGLADA